MKEKIAFVFPGQGSQSVGMLAHCYENMTFKRSFQEANDTLGYDLFGLVKNGPELRLNQTRYTQPALLTASVALWRMWQDQLPDTQPVLFAGHSLGEYTALVCAEALSLSDAVLLVAERGHLMQEAVPEDVGAMAAILGLLDEQVEAICSENAGDECVLPANYNCPGQVVVAGHRSAVIRVIEAAKMAGAKRALLLPVSVPSHCPLMKPAAHQFAQQLTNIAIQPPSIPVIHNVDVKEHSIPSDIRNALIQQLYSAVQWVKTIRSMEAFGVKKIFECGAGAVLSGLNKRIAPNLQCIGLSQEVALCL